MRNMRYLLAALALVGAAITGCSSSSGSPGEDGGSDGRTTSDARPNTDSPVNKQDAPVTHQDGSSVPDTGTDSFTPPPGEGGTPDTGSPEAGETGPGPCNFNTFVIGLITNDTTATAIPSTNLGQTCTDDHTPFPSSLF